MRLVASTGRATQGREKAYLKLNKGKLQINNANNSLSNVAVMVSIAISERIRKYKQSTAECVGLNCLYILLIFDIYFSISLPWSHIVTLSADVVVTGFLFGPIF